MMMFMFIKYNRSYVYVSTEIENAQDLIKSVEKLITVDRDTEDGRDMLDMGNSDVEVLDLE